MTGLRLGGGLVLPPEAVTQTFGILAKRGAGKSNTAAVMAEEMFKAALPFVVVDPVGAWWGLRSSSDGKGPGLEVPIFGGHRGDVPLERGGAELVADLIVDESLSCVVDVSAFESETAKREFLATFAERLFRRKGQPGRDAPLHLFLEEADDYAPQRSAPAIARCLGAFQRIVKQGRARGLGSTMISQRSAALNKDLLTQIETLIVLRTTGPHDRKAIAEWVKYHGQAEELLASLHQLEPGEAWVWSPWLDLTKRVQIRRRRTFDSGATPTLAAKKAPATLADVDLDVLRAAMAATIEKAKAEDPKLLMKRIRELEAELRARPTEARVDTVVERVEVVPKDLPVILRSIEYDLDTLRKARESFGSMIDDIAKRIGQKLDSAKNLGRGVAERGERALPASSGGPTPNTAPRTAPRPAANPAGQSGEPVRSAPSIDGIGDYAGALLKTLAERHPMRLSRTQLSTLSGRSKRSSMFGPAVRELLEAGLVKEAADKKLELTPEGVDTAGATASAATPAELQAMWLGKLPPYESSLLKVLIDASGSRLTREELASRSGRSMTSSMFGPSIRTLVDAGLADVDDGTIAAAETLFL